MVTTMFTPGSTKGSRGGLASKSLNFFSGDYYSQEEAYQEDKEQELQCTECSMIAHADCTHLVPDFCKMLMETAIRLLQEIKTAQSFQSNRIRAIASAKSTSNSGHSIQLGVSRLQLRTNEPRAFPVPKTAKYQLCQPGMATSTGSQSSKPVSSDQVPLPHSLPYHPCPLPSNPDAPPSMSPTKGPSQRSILG
ncbi:hypothetical protein BY996DRAFT_6585774 [Phakopsora pachyrhizi]|nr:hypothetical protein BY996DRAFT_6585774 [Phakopsora pachyrhizi]